MIKKTCFLGTIILFCFLVGFLKTAQASTVIPLNLEQMAIVADRVFEGECLFMQEDLDENDLPVTYITFSVNRVFKGDLEDVVTIKQYGAKPREDLELLLWGSGSHVIPAIKGLSRPLFQKGERVILFLYPDSEWGFTSPVGLGQGKFIVTADEEDNKTISNGFMKFFSRAAPSQNLLKSIVEPSVSAQTLSIRTHGVSYKNFINTLGRLKTIQRKFTPDVE